MHLLDPQTMYEKFRSILSKETILDLIILEEGEIINKLYDSTGLETKLEYFRAHHPELCNGYRLSSRGELQKIPDLQNIAAALNNLPEKYRDLAMQLLSIRDDQDEAEIMDLVMWDCEDEPRPKCLTSEEPNHKKYTELLAAAKEVCLNYKDTQDNYFNATEIAAFETSISELGELVGINRD